MEIALGGGRRLLLGPNALAEIPALGSARILRGEAEGIGTKESPLVLLGPGEFRRELTAPLAIRAEAETTVALAEPPRWLTGYRDSTTDEWMGSLVAQVDGRGVPLTVGYHAVDVVIRDQIAQTTVEQSFVNHTPHAIEGVFTFPLPADASVSGFGMWIDDELVEADIVERQRARQIYEEIRHERRDPGLLEWSGGNLFKASVWPIPGGGEKRIRIRYTQVLPREGDSVRYRYRLRSELLRKHPVRQLRVKLSVHSST
ncbi:MAG: hypothetical protein GY704_11690, partial [Phycisphaeraceae bacterium]|nr:hypothetical protein [Phycisphaeraceae bacterium]